MEIRVTYDQLLATFIGCLYDNCSQPHSIQPGTKEQQENPHEILQVTEAAKFITSDIIMLGLSINFRNNFGSKFNVNLNLKFDFKVNVSFYFYHEWQQEPG